MGTTIAVDIGGLRSCALRIDDAVAAVAPVRLAPAPIGHPRLDAALSGFDERWELGLANVGIDAAAHAERLRAAACAYSQVDEGAGDLVRRLTALITSSGTLPDRMGPL